MEGPDTRAPAGESRGGPEGGAGVPETRFFTELVLLQARGSSRTHPASLTPSAEGRLRCSGSELAPGPPVLTERPASSCPAGFRPVLLGLWLGIPWGLDAPHSLPRGLSLHHEGCLFPGPSTAWAPWNPQGLTARHAGLEPNLDVCLLCALGEVT